MQKIDTQRIMREFENNPIAFMAAGAAFLTGFGKLIDGASAAWGRRAYAKQVNYRVKHKR